MPMLRQHESGRNSSFLASRVLFGFLKVGSDYLILQGYSILAFGILSQNKLINKQIIIQIILFLLCLGIL